MQGQACATGLATPAKCRGAGGSEPVRARNRTERLLGVLPNALKMR